MIFFSPGCLARSLFPRIVLSHLLRCGRDDDAGADPYPLRRRIRHGLLSSLFFKLECETRAHARIRRLIAGVSAFYGLRQVRAAG